MGQYLSISYFQDGFFKSSCENQKYKNDLETKIDDCISKYLDVCENNDYNCVYAICIDGKYKFYADTLSIANDCADMLIHQSIIENISSYMHFREQKINDTDTILYAIKFPNIFSYESVISKISIVKLKHYKLRNNSNDNI